MARYVSRQTTSSPSAPLSPRWLSALQATLKEFYPEGALNSASYGRIVSDLHFERLKRLIDRTTGKVVAGGEMRAEERGIAPTVVIDVRPGDSLLEGCVLWCAEACYY